MFTTRTIRSALLGTALAASLTLVGSCGSARELIGTQDVTVFAAAPFSNSFILGLISANDASYFVGDTSLDTATATLLAFPIDGGLEPSGFRVKSAQIVFDVVSVDGNPQAIAPIRVDHVTTDLTGGGDAGATDVGDLPLAMTPSIGSVADAETPGTRSVVVTGSFLTDWNTPGRTLSANFLQMTPTSNNSTADRTEMAGATHATTALRPRLIITFELDI